MSRLPVFNSDVRPQELLRVTELRSAMYWLYETGIQGGESTGWPTLDKFYTVRLREWTLISGIPSHGKTALLDGLMLNLARSKQWRFAVFSAENLPHERHVADLMAQYIGRPFGPGMRTRISKAEFEAGMQFLDAYFTFLNPPQDACTIDRILELADMLTGTPEGLQGLVIDPWNELDHSRPPSLNETEYVSRALTKIRRFARDHEVHVFLVAHPTKLQRIKTVNRDGAEVSVYPVPTPYDVSGSAHFRNKADNCLCVWRDVADPGYGADIHVQKIRFREIGQVGICHMGYDLPTNALIDSLAPRRPFAMRELSASDLMPVGHREPGQEG